MPSIRWRSQLSDAMRTRLWPVPMIGVCLAIASAVFVPALDQAIDARLPSARPLFDSTMDDARELLGTISTALITVTSLTFSLTVVTLQLASGQYSPRLLRTFARDRFVQTTLALFLATFAYALTLLSNIRNGPGTDPDAVPQLAVAVAALLALASVVGLVVFLAHLVGEIRVEAMMHTVCVDALTTMSDVFTEERFANSTVSRPNPPADAAIVCGHATGFLVNYDMKRLSAAAEQADAIVFVHREPGQWMVAGDPVACVWARDPEMPLTEDRLATLSERVRAALRAGYERTPTQDVGYALRQLTDVAAKALSPGINDPTTAMHAIGNSSALLCRLIDRHLDFTNVRRDGIVRVTVCQPGFADLLGLAVDQPRRYGAKDPLVLGQLFAMLREIAWQSSDPDQKSAIAAQLTRLRATAARQDFDKAELDGLDDLGREVEEALAGCWKPGQRSVRVPEHAAAGTGGS